MMGGSPFNVAASLGHGKENVRIVAGTNLPMLVEIVMSRKFMDDLDGLGGGVHMDLSQKIIAAILAGLALFVTGLRLPGPLVTAMEGLGSCKHKPDLFWRG